VGPESLKVMQAALDRYLREEECDYSIVKDVDSEAVVEFLMAKQLCCKRVGKVKGQGKQIP